MKTRDLRLGNFLKYDDNILCEVAEIYEKEIYCFDKYGEDLHSMEFIKPIELTEDLLVNLFGKPRTNGNKFDIYNIPTRGIEIQDRRKSALPTPTICIVKFGVHICNIKYLHELQNIFYYLTKQELEIDL